MGRRAITVNLDPKCETPATRRFKADPLRLVRSERGGYVSAALTIVMAWLANGKPMTDCEPFGGYGQWRELVCQPLLWLGLPDPAISGFESLETDPDRETLGRLMTSWRCKLGDAPTQVRALVRAADDGHDSDTVELREVLKDIAEVRGEISRQRLGRWISRHANRNVGGFRLVKDGHGCGADRWRVVVADAP